MIKVNYKMLDEPLEVKGLTSLILKDSKLFSDFIQNLYQYDSESQNLKIFNEEYKPIKESELMIITDILGYDINTAAVVQLVHKNLESIITEEPETKNNLEELIHQICKIINKKMIESEIDLESQEVNINDIIKSMKIKVEIKTDTIYERALEIIQIFKYLSNKKILIFLNLGTYVNEDEIKIIEEYIELNNIRALLVERYDFKGTKNKVIIDEDLVILSRKKDIIMI